MPSALSAQRQPGVPIWPEPSSAPPSARPFLLPPPTPSAAGLGSSEVTAHPSPGGSPNLTGCQSHVLVCVTPTRTSAAESRASRAGTHGEGRAASAAPLVSRGARRPSGTRAGRPASASPVCCPPLLRGGRGAGGAGQIRISASTTSSGTGVSK